MPNFLFATACNKPRLRDPTKACEIISQFWFDWDLAVGVETDELGEQRLNIQGEGWPGAWLIPAQCKAADFAPDPRSDGIADFESLLVKFGPCLDEPLIVQAIGSVQGQYPLLASEWSLTPNSSLVQRRELTSGEPAGAFSAHRPVLQPSAS